MAGASAESGKFSNTLLSNLPGVVSAIVLAAGVGYICKYNFFLLLVVFIVLYFVTGTAAEFLIVVLHIEKVKYDRKKQGKATAKKGQPACADIGTKTNSQEQESPVPAEESGEPGPLEEQAADLENAEGKSPLETTEISDMRDALVPNRKARMQYIASCKVKLLKSDDFAGKTKEEENET